MCNTLENQDIPPAEKLAHPAYVQEDKTRNSLLLQNPVNPIVPREEWPFPLRNLYSTHITGNLWYNTICIHRAITDES